MATLNKPEAQPEKREAIVIKKYANRRLYNTETSTYVTLEDLGAMVREDRDFVVYDAKTSDDLTRSVLTQIIVEQEGRVGGQTLLPVPFLPIKPTRSPAFRRKKISRRTGRPS